MFLFRTDGNPDIGAGHIMRCLAIADAGHRIGENCLFTVASSHFSNVIKGHGHKVLVLDTDYKNMLSDLDRMKQLIREQKPSVLFVDSYQVSAAYMSALWETCRDMGCRLVYIDDLVAFAYPCDVILNYNIYGPDQKDEYKSLYRESGILCPKLLLGTNYVPLRAEFQNLPKRIVKEQAQRILISTGGADPDHLAKNFAKYIVRNSSRFKHFKFHFVIGAMNEDRFEIEELTKTNETIILHYNVQHMEQLMSDIDLAISAAGSTLYELCATQTPAITYILADNQIPGAKKFEENGVLYCAGDMRELKNSFIENVLEEAVRLAKDYKKRVRIADRESFIVDGNGAERIMEEVYGGQKS